MLFFGAWLLAFAAGVVALEGAQQHWRGGYELNKEGYSVLSHPLLPRHTVRVKPTQDFCDPTVNVFTGYIDIEARHFFFYYFESRRAPAKDDVVLWLNGGPGASSSIGLFMELGPCLINGTGTAFNPYGWNSQANLLIVDQPVGVGFSYADHGETVANTPDAAKDMAAFMAIFMNSLPGLKGRAVHIAGESFGGRAEIYDQNRALRAQGQEPVNLSSIIIGNGATNIYRQVMQAAYVEMQCTGVSGLPPLQSISICTRMREILPRCQTMLKRSCIETFDLINCQWAEEFCGQELVVPFALTGRSNYDMSKPCYGEVQDTLCYSETVDIRRYLDLPATRKKLHVSHHFDDRNVSLASWPVNVAFASSGDTSRSSSFHIEALLERGVRVLIYAGEYDFICNMVGNEAMSQGLEWSGQEAFGKTALRDWKVDSEAVGKTRSFGLLTFATVAKASHMVPYDRPKEALALLNRWLDNVAL